jgi:hypothetical protein
MVGKLEKGKTLRVQVWHLFARRNQPGPVLKLFRSTQGVQLRFLFVRAA